MNIQSILDYADRYRSIFNTTFGNGDPFIQEVSSLIFISVLDCTVVETTLNKNQIPSYIYTDLRYFRWTLMRARRRTSFLPSDLRLK